MRLVFKSKLFQNKKGQILVEYLLLMVISVAAAALLTKALVGRGENDDRGILIKQWDGILRKMGNDMPACSKQTDFNNPSCPP